MWLANSEKLLTVSIIVSFLYIVLTIVQRLANVAFYTVVALNEKSKEESNNNQAEASLPNNKIMLKEGLSSNILL